MKEFNLTQTELFNIFSWKPYRADWPIDLNKNEDNINSTYGLLINEFTNNQNFNCIFKEDGGMSNYLEFICYPKSSNNFEGNSIVVFISLCAPIAGYGQSKLIIYQAPKKNGMKRFFKQNMIQSSISYNGLFKAEDIGLISDNSLSQIKDEIDSILQRENIHLLKREFVSIKLSKGLMELLNYENNNEGDTYLQGIFQHND